MRQHSSLLAVVLASFIVFSGTESPPSYDVVILNGRIYDGSGNTSYVADVGILRDTIAEIGDLRNASARVVVNASGLAVSPGFINMLSWADRSLLADGRSMSNIKQGVTLEVFGEGISPGPERRRTSKPIDSLWTTLGGYFTWAMKKGVSPNIASFVGATSVRIHELDFANRPPSSQELERMKDLVRQSMEEGALGLGSSLIYPPATYATTEELIALARIASQYGGIYITHLRSEGDYILEALDEAIRISVEADIPVEIYHLKVNIQRNWRKIDAVLARIDSARRAGVRLTANMYPYTASATGLTSRLPAWIQDGGAIAMRRRLKNPAIRRRVLWDMQEGIPYKNSEPSNVCLMGFRLDSLQELYGGKRLDEVARLHGRSVDETTLDLIVCDKSRIECIYFLQSENNIRRIMQKPYVSFGSDAGSFSIDRPFERWSLHPRAYGTFARILGKYVRDEHVLGLEEAIRRMTSLPATNLRLNRRGRIETGYFADIVVFDPRSVRETATFENPAQYAEGVKHVFVNGVAVLLNGEHTNKMPGRVLVGPGFKKSLMPDYREY